MNSPSSISPGGVGDRSAGILTCAISIISSVIVHDLNVFGARVGPPEAHPPLIVDPNRILSSSLTLELFQAVARRSAQVPKQDCLVEQVKLSPRRAHKVRRASPARLLGVAPVERVFGALVPERCDHLAQYNGSRNPWQGCLVRPGPVRQEAVQQFPAAHRVGLDRMTVEPCITAMLSFAPACVLSRAENFPDCPDSLKEPRSTPWPAEVPP